MALDFSLAKPTQVVIAGANDDPRTQKLLAAFHTRFLPNRILMLADGGRGQNYLAAAVPFLGSLPMIEGKPTAYICENYACNLPTSDPDEVLRMISR